MFRRRAQMVWILVAVVSVLAVACSSPGSTPAGSILGDVLSQLTGQVQTIIASAQSQFDLALLDAANQTQNLIDDIASQYGPALDRTVSADENNAIEQVDGLIDKLHSGTTDIIAQVNGDATQYTLALCPLPTCNRPQVRGYTPHNVAPTAGSQVKLDIAGIFPFARSPDPNNKPVLVANGQRIESSGENEQALEFFLPAGLYPKAPAGGFIGTSFELEVPYQDGVLNQKVKAGAYRIGQSLFPTAPLKSLVLTTYTQTMQPVPRQYPFGGGTNHVDSFDCHTHTWPTNGVPDAVHPVGGPGAVIDPTSIKVVYDEDKNPNAAKVTISDPGPQGFGVLAITSPVCGLFGISNGSGDITYHVTYNELIPTPATSTSDLLATHPEVNSWQASLSLPVVPHQWSLSGATSDGVSFGINHTDHTPNRYVSVTDQSNQITIVLAPVDQV